MIKELTTSGAFLVAVAVLVLGYATKVIWPEAPFLELAGGVGTLFGAFAIKRHAKERLDQRTNGERNGDA